jgi:hypothetical protein
VVPREVVSRFFLTTKLFNSSYNPGWELGLRYFFSASAVSGSQLVSKQQQPAKSLHHFAPPVVSSQDALEFVSFSRSSKTPAST